MSRSLLVAQSHSCTQTSFNQSNFFVLIISFQTMLLQLNHSFPYAIIIILYSVVNHPSCNKLRRSKTLLCLLHFSVHIPSHRLDSSCINPFWVYYRYGLAASSSASFIGIYWNSIYKIRNIYDSNSKNTFQARLLDVIHWLYRIR